MLESLHDHVQLNGRKLESAEDVADRRGMGGGTVRAVRFPCPPEAVQSGYNDLHVRQTDGPAAQQIVWAEIRVEP